jgi:hypothetical protein
MNSSKCMTQILFHWALCVTVIFALTGCVTQPKLSQNKTKNLTTRQMLTEINSIETEFLSQNCSVVSTHANGLKKSKISTDDLPPLAQAAIVMCDTEGNQNDKKLLSQNIVNLKRLSFHYPVLNEAWFHEKIAHFYTLLGDTQNAQLEQTTARNLAL